MKILQISFYTFIFSFFLSAQSEGRLIPLVAGFQNPTDLTCPFDGTNRLFVTEKAGRIKIIHSDMMVSTFLNISDQVSTSSERGLLGLAFHPEFVDNRYFFVSYTDLGDDFNSVISRFTVDENNSNEVDLESEKVIMRIPQPFDNHNGGDLAFGPDGYLYIGLGDGGSGGDPRGSGQNLGSLLGKILRIDINVGGDTLFNIPSDNPFISDANAMDEIWSYGLRNPWRFSFDRETGDIWIGDVGQGEREEISVNPAGVGGLNFGWKCFEGSLPFSNCDEIVHEEPIYTYARPDKNACMDSRFCGKSVTGGFVYRGTDNPLLIGKYFFADYASNHLWSYDLEKEFVSRIDDMGNATDISSFGEDEQGEIYVVSYRGGIYKLAQSVSTSNKVIDIPEIQLTPNPASEFIKMEFPQQGIYSISTIDGKLVEKKEILGNTTTLNVSEYPPGSYNVRFLFGDNMLNKKFIKI